MKLLSIFLATQTLKNLRVRVLFVLLFYIFDLRLNVWFRQISRSLSRWLHGYMVKNMVIKIVTFLKILKSFKTIFNPWN